MKVIFNKVTQPALNFAGYLSTSRVNSKVIILLLVAICFVSRLPILLHADMMLNGDEAIIGLMSKHLLEGKNFALYYYGQQYGLSIFETLAGALSFKLFGMGDIQLKLAMLTIFCIGLIYFYLATQLLFGKYYGFLSTILFGLTSIWLNWSMQARGGYITAFALTSVALYMLVKKTPAQREGVFWIGISFLVALIFLAQPLWIPGLLPLIFFKLIHKRKTVLLCVGWLGPVILILFMRYLLAKTSTSYWWPQIIEFENISWNFFQIPDRIYYQITYTHYQTSNFGQKIIGFVWFMLIGSGLIIQMYRLLWRKYYFWSHVFFVSTFFTIACSLIFTYQPRYLLPLSQFLILWTFADITDLSQRSKLFQMGYSLLIALLLLVGTGKILLNYYQVFNESEKQLRQKTEIETLIKYLTDHKIYHVYSLDPLFQWQLTFYSKEKILARWKHPEDRYPLYPLEVDMALESGKNTAIVGLQEEIATYQYPHLFEPAGSTSYQFCENPEKKTLIQLGFKLNEVSY